MNDLEIEKKRNNLLTMVDPTDRKGLWRQMGNASGIAVLITAGRQQMAGKEEYLSESRDAFYPRKGHLVYVHEGPSGMVVKDYVASPYLESQNLGLYFPGDVSFSASADVVAVGYGRCAGAAALTGRNEPAETAQAILRDYVRLEKLGNTEAALDFLYDKIDAMLKQQKHEIIESLFHLTALPEASVDLMLALLTATLPARSRIVNRKSFFGDVAKELRRREIVDDTLLAGLES